MASISTYLADKLLDHTFGGGDYTPPATLYYALFLVLPAADGTGGVEVTGGSYARKSLTNNTTNHPAASGGQKTNGVAITFATPTADWGATVGAGIYDSSTGGNLLCMGLWANGVTRSILNGITFTIDAGSEIASITGGFWSYYLSNAMLDLVFGATSFTRPSTIYAASFTTMPSLANTGGVEPSTGSYARVSTTNDATHFPAASANLKSNALSITWPTATGSWGLQLGMGWYDASTSGNLITMAVFPSPQSITTGGILGILANQWTASLV